MADSTHLRMVSRSLINPDVPSMWLFIRNMCNGSDPWPTPARACSLVVSFLGTDERGCIPGELPVFTHILTQLEMPQLSQSRTLTYGEAVPSSSGSTMPPRSDVSSSPPSSASERVASELTDDDPF
eukprot:TRINITY_DN56753_c0_g1_i1.p1 TRINITY_DN56753_c0_g1~~TRINITY_DN56753_c0_g1_i1.p1  ORF type:complete len:135 (+),score=2.17 TRINITY_DN56753_c0_g1_i1:28-405(+)